MEDIRAVAQMIEQRTGYKSIQISIHRDEGHKDNYTKMTPQQRTKQNWLSRLIYGNQRQICQECQDASNAKIEKLKEAIANLMAKNAEQGEKIRELERIIVEKQNENVDIKATIVAERYELKVIKEELDQYKQPSQKTASKTTTSKAGSKTLKL